MPFILVKIASNPVTHMNTTGQRRILATPADIHRHFGSATAMQACLPPHDSFTGSLPAGYDFAVSRKIGLFGVTFRGRITFAEAREGEAYVMDITGSSPVSGRLAAQVTLHLTPRPRATLIACEARYEPNSWMKILGAERVERAFTTGVGAFLDRLKATLEA